MTRSEFDDIRAHIAAEDRPDELLLLATDLLDDLERVRTREALLRSLYLGLLTAARAAVAARAAGHPEPLVFLVHELAKHGQLPEDGQAERILADATSAQELMAAAVDDPCPRRHQRPGRPRHCGGVSRALRT